MKKEKGLEILKERIEDFEKNKALIMKKGYGETNIRSNYIDIMLEALGWDIRNKYEVDREFSQKDRSKEANTKKVDYAFKLNGKLKFFIEAKEASVDLEHDKKAIYQAKRYAYSSNGKAPIVILTDFEEFRVFNVLVAPIYDNPDKQLLKSHSFQYTDYIKKWNLLWETFSKEAVENGSLEKLRGTITKNTKTMDKDFLEQITKWREDLAKNIAIRNKDLSVDDINEAVQRILDRFIFIRNLEDREIEPENTLLNITKNKTGILKALRPLFNHLNTAYNGLLFRPHFSEKIKVDDKTLYDIIREMCYPISPFQFDIIEPEILGRIYEKFLGSKIRLTDSHRAKVEEKIEVRKAGGVYYTPEYIVDYIVKNTVGAKIDGLTPDEIKDIKIIDPACGSGSFLLGAYHYLLDYHRQWYIKNKKNKDYKADWYKTRDGEIVVNLDKRGDILKNNIFGVDIDKEATEVAIMSLYLKMLDDGFDKGERDLFFVKGAVLPDMIANIKWGNSLIDNSFFDEKLHYSDEEYKNVKPFSFKEQFLNLNKNGLFDIILGNPPWVSLSGKFGNDILNKDQIDYLIKKYNANTYMPNLYEYFISKGLDLVDKNGIFSFIVPDRFGLNNQFVNLRKRMLVDFQIKKLLYKAKFPEVIADTLIFVIHNSVEKLSMIRVGEFRKELQNIEFKKYMSDSKHCFEYTKNKDVFYVLEKIGSLPTIKCIGEIFDTTSGFGGKSEKITSNKVNENQIPIIKGKNIQKYFIKGKLYFEFTKSNITGRTTDKSKLGASEKILLRKTGYPIFAAYDSTGIFPEQSLYFLFNNKTKISFAFFLGIINSNVFQFYYWNKLVTNKNSTPQLKKVHLDIFPIPVINIDEKYIKDMIFATTKLNDVYIKLNNSKSENDKELCKRQINSLEKQVNTVAYSIYKLNDKEISILENNL